MKLGVKILLIWATLWAIPIWPNSGFAGSNQSTCSNTRKLVNRIWEDVEKKVELGQPQDFFVLGIFYAVGFGGRKIDYEKAEVYLRKAAEKSFPKAQFQLACLYFKGKLGQPDYVEARYWFEKASSQQVREANTFLAQIYRDGLGVSPDPELAQKFANQSLDETGLLDGFSWVDLQ